LDRPQASYLTPGRIVFAVVAVAVFVLDHITKSLVAAQIPYGTEIPVVGHLVGLTNVRNSGAAFGLAPTLAAVFQIASVVVSIGLVVYVARTSSPFWTDAVLGLVLGGTAGNGFDRIVYGTVTDFVNVHFWPVFNVADSAISIGVTALILGQLLRKNPHEL
jgi:signal peptidase II